MEFKSRTDQKSHTRFQRLTTAATLKCDLWCKAAEMTLVTLEMVLSEYNIDFIFKQFCLF